MRHRFDEPYASVRTLAAHNSSGLLILADRSARFILADSICQTSPSLYSTRSRSFRFSETGEISPRPSDLCLGSLSRSGSPFGCRLRASIGLQLVGPSTVRCPFYFRDKVKLIEQNENAVAGGSRETCSRVASLSTWENSTPGLNYCTRKFCKVNLGTWLYDLGSHRSNLSGSFFQVIASHQALINSVSIQK